jgi:hypothetical protein
MVVKISLQMPDHQELDLDDEWKYSLIIMIQSLGTPHPVTLKVKLLIILQIKNLLIDLKKQFTRSSVSHV